MNCRLLAAGAGETAAAWFGVELGEVALNHERSGDGEVRGIGGAAGVEAVVGDEEEELLAGVRDMAAEGERRVRPGARHPWAGRRLAAHRFLPLPTGGCRHRDCRYR